MRVRILLLIDKLHLEVVTHVGYHNFHTGLGNSLAKADSPAPKEGNESCSISFLSSWGQRERMAHVETLRQEFSWTLPLLGVAVQVEIVDHHGVAGLDLKVAKLGILTQELDA